MKKILYFTDDFSQENQDFAKEHGLLIRNAQAYETVDYLEKCDMVCGDVPLAYEQSYPIFELPQVGQSNHQEPSNLPKNSQDDEQPEPLDEVVETPMADEASDETASVPSVDEATKDELTDEPKSAEPTDKTAKTTKAKTTKKSA